MARSIMQLTVDGLTRSFANWACITGINEDKLRQRHKRGWTPRQCVGYDDPPKRVYRLGPVGPWQRPNYLTELQPVEIATTTITIHDHKATGAAVRSIRQRAGKSAMEAAAECGWSYQVLHRMESGAVKWTQKRLDRFNEVAKGWVKQ